MFAAVAKPVITAPKNAFSLSACMSVSKEKLAQLPTKEAEKKDKFKVLPLN